MVMGWRSWPVSSRGLISPLLAGLGSGEPLWETLSISMVVSESDPGEGARPKGKRGPAGRLGPATAERLSLPRCKVGGDSLATRLYFVCRSTCRSPLATSVRAR